MRVICVCVCVCVFFVLLFLAGFWVLQSAGSVWAGWRCGICSRALPSGRVLRPKAAQLLLVCGVCVPCCVWCVVVFVLSSETLFKKNLALFARVGIER